ncbi:YbfB/YjiJ family MFS transporter [Shewanella surugensis]|uniref:MFS transporter n=1 Tax=Shewanella surugensis TaxID=212020 RepID=A0ABT0LII4_9GAMM|nr:YbfB/YjiJ family MFS transporter [Shewanella surugensis]MCL1127499.1 MFS transporter [Shewanella surugensis]
MVFSHKKAGFYNAFSGFCLLLLALGINRFAYTPAIPFLINEHWLSNVQAGYVGSANFLGYFLGALTAHKLNQLFKTSHLMLSLLTISLVAAALCTFEFGYWWLTIWRLVLGINGGAIMILAPSLILTHLPDSQKAMISGIIFAGIGVGTALSSISIPLFFSVGNVTGIWIGLVLITLVLVLLTWQKCANAPSYRPTKQVQKINLTHSQKRTFTIALIGYGLYGVGLTPSLLFLSDYAHRTLHMSLQYSSTLFAILGLGAAVGAISAGILHHKLGNFLGVIITGIIGIISLFLIAWFPSLIFVAISAFLSGFYLIALVTLMSLFIGHLVSMQHHAKYWAYMTLLYGASQFIASYAFSYGLSVNLSYVTMFKIGALALTLSLLCYLYLKPEAQ